MKAGLADTLVSLYPRFSRGEVWARPPSRGAGAPQNLLTTRGPAEPRLVGLVGLVQDAASSLCACLLLSTF